MTCVALSQFSTPLGDMIVVADDDGLLFLGFSDQPKRERVINDLTRKRDVFPSNEHTINIQRELAAYFDGRLQSLTTPCVWERGTPFQQRTWQTLELIPYGKTVSYAQVATSMHQPTAYRAVALANGSNPFVIRVPCHRVIRNNGDLCGYNAGIHRKIWLLEFEKQHAEQLAA